MNRLRGAALTFLAVVVSMVLAGSASATTLTSPAGTAYTGAVKAQSGDVVIQNGSNSYTCTGSQLGWETKSHGANPVQAAITSFTLEKCSEKTTVTVAQKGGFEILPLSFGYYPIRWAGFEITTAQHLLFGTVHCTFKGEPPGYEFGGLTPSFAGQTAVIHVAATLPRASGPCGKSIKLIAEYVVSSPHYLGID